MGMGSPMGRLLRNAQALRQTWQVWFEGLHEGREKEIVDNLEYFLKETELAFKDVKEEWRSAFRKGPERPILHESFHHDVVCPKAAAIEKKWNGLA